MKNRLGLFAVLMCAGLAFSQETYPQWSYYKTITINTTNAAGGANVPGTVSNFPVLVRLTSANADVFTNAAADGADIRFAASDGTTPLKYQRDRWDAVNQLAEFWVLVPSVAGNANTTFRILWGKSGAADSSNGAAVFDTSNAFRGVWHLGKGSPNSATVLDSDATVNANHLKWLYGTSAETTSVVRGNISRADSLPNISSTGTTSNFLATSSNNSFVIGTANGMTLSAWVKRVGKGGGTPANPTSSDEGIAMRFRFTTTGTSNTSFRLWGLEYTPATKGTTNGAGSGNFTTHGNGYSFHYSTSGASGGEAFLCSGVVDSGNWDHLVATENGTSQALWVNGVMVASSALATTNLDVPNTTVASGAASAAFTVGKLDSADVTYNQTFNGVIDEVELQRTVRDSNWIKLSYATQTPSATALTLGSTVNNVAATAPGAPTAVLGTSGNGQVAVSCTAPASNGGSTITGYTVTAVQDTARKCTTTGTLTCTVTGLTNGNAYTFTVTATNSAGTSVASSPSASVTPSASAGVPGAPTGAAGVAGNAQVTVSWTAPSSTGTSAITGYAATSNPDGKTCNSSGALNCIVTGLTNGTSYTFTVTATNTAGTGPASSPSANVTPVGAPAAPTGAAGVAGNAQVVVSWTASSNGGSAITGYTATSVEDTSKHCSTTGALSCTVTGLTNGTPYTFTIKAANALGASPASIASGAVTPLTVPGAPTAVTGVGDVGQVTVSWASPVSNGGAAITGYTALTVQDTTKRCNTNGALTCTVTGLNNTTSYTFIVRAANSVGVGTASAPSSPVTDIRNFSAKSGFGFQMTPSSILFRIPEGMEGTLVVMDVWGRSVWNSSVALNAREAIWDKHAAVPGVYIVRFIRKDTNRKSKLMAESKFLLTP